MDRSGFESWCRLCGSPSGTALVEGALELTVIRVIELEIHGKLICTDCLSFMQRIDSFADRSRSIQEMYFELEQSDYVENVDIIRAHYGLVPVDESKLKQEELKQEEVDVVMEFEDVLEESLVDYQETEEPDEYAFEVARLPNRRSASKKPPVKNENEKLYDFTCHVCGDEFLKMTALSSHCRTVHQTLPKFLCLCGDLLSTWKRLMAHKARHVKEAGEFTCEICNVSYKKKSAFDRHTVTKHGPDAEKFVCSQCGKEFKDKQILKTHEMAHLPDELKFKYPCSYCGKKFVNSHCVQIHIARIHEKIALHTCKLCGKGCVTKTDLDWHMG